MMPVSAVNAAARAILHGCISPKLARRAQHWHIMLLHHLAATSTVEYPPQRKIVSKLLVVMNCHVNSHAG
jgi:hypothetical protein